MASAHHGVVYTKKMGCRPDFRRGWLCVRGRHTPHLSVAAMGATTLRCGVCKAVSFAPFRHAGLGFLVFRFLV